MSFDIDTNINTNHMNAQTWTRKSNIDAHMRTQTRVLRDKIWATSIQEKTTFLPGRIGLYLNMIRNKHGMASSIQASIWL